MPYPDEPECQMTEDSPTNDAAEVPGGDSEQPPTVTTAAACELWEALLAEPAPEQPEFPIPAALLRYAVALVTKTLASASAKKKPDVQLFAEGVVYGTSGGDGILVKCPTFSGHSLAVPGDRVPELLGFLEGTARIRPDGNLVTASDGHSINLTNTPPAARTFREPRQEDDHAVVHCPSRSHLEAVVRRLMTSGTDIPANRFLLSLENGTLQFHLEPVGVTVDPPEARYRTRLRTRSMLMLIRGVRGDLSLRFRRREGVNPDDPVDHGVFMTSDVFRMNDAGHVRARGTHTCKVTRMAATY